MPKEIFIVGPTGAGKSEYANRLFTFIYQSNKYAKVAMVNVDSISFYKYFDLSSAKPIYQDRIKYHYYGIDIAVADKPINVYDFSMYYKNLKENTDHTHIILVGGSGLYIDSIYYNYSFSDSFDFSFDYWQDPNLKHNHRRYIGLNRRGWHHNIDRKNSPSNSNKTIIGLYHDGLSSEDFIINRFQNMLDLGAVDEAKSLIDRYGADNTVLQSINYRSLVSYIVETKSMEWLLSDVVSSNKRLIKKQRTWFKRNQDLYWIDPSQDNNHEYMWSGII